ARSSRGRTAPGAAPDATCVEVVRKARACAAMPSAISRRSGSFWISPMPVTLPSAADEAPALEGPAERHLVRVLQVSPDRQPRREAGHAQTHGAQHARQVRRGGLALD